MKEPGPSPSESGAHDVVPAPQGYRRATDCANHGNRIATIERAMWSIGGGMAVMAFFGMYAAMSFFNATDKMSASSKDIAVILEKVSRTSEDMSELKSQYRDLSNRMSIAEKDIASLKK